MFQTAACIFTRFRSSARRATLALAAALALVAWPEAAPGQDVRATQGEWGDVIPFDNVPIHVNVLPNGKVLYWGRREWRPDGTPAEGLDPRDCTPRLWDPVTGQKKALDRPGFNLFCAGHTFLADGRLFVVGGHVRDNVGEDRATLFDFRTDQWKETDQKTNAGRWYPTAVTLPDGAVLVSSGSIRDNPQVMNKDQQIWRPGPGGERWSSTVEHRTLPYYPRMHVAPDGRIVMAGTTKFTQLLNTQGAGGWTPIGDFKGEQREYGASVMYEPGKVLIAGGGLPPQKSAEVIDLNQTNPGWRSVGDMNVERRHHNATLLPDGTVLVTGGSRGRGGPNGGFNDLSAPALEAELWDPAAENQWTPLAKEKVPRMYHSTGVLLPDARVLSAGGGEYKPDNQNPNDDADSRRDAQVFSPPYLFRGARPKITRADDEVKYGVTFDVETDRPADVGRVSWVRLSSVTHSYNMNQRINFLKFAVDGGKLEVTPPVSPNLCPPGHYMLFVLNRDGVPSVAKIVRIDQ